MFRRLVVAVSLTDTLGFTGILLVALAAYLVDPRLAIFLVGATLVLVAVVRSLPSAPPEPPQAAE